LRDLVNQWARSADIKEYSDPLLIFLLKAARPEKYRGQSV
jgi:hypothetical protein